MRPISDSTTSRAAPLRKLARGLALSTAVIAAAAFGSAAWAQTATTTAPAKADTAAAAAAATPATPAPAAGAAKGASASDTASGTASDAAADTAGSAPPAAIVDTLDKLTGGKVKVTKVFKAPAGLLGVAISEGPGQDGIIYMTPDGKYVLRGDIISADGTNVTQNEADQYLPKPPGAAENFASLSKTHTYLWGKPSAKKDLWIVFDPNCIYCHKTYEDLKSFVEKGEVKVHIIQVGFLKPSSLGKAAAILAAKDPAAALKTDESKFDTATEEGGIKGDTSDAKAVALVKQNNAWMQAQGVGGTPYLLFRDPQGKPHAIGGYDPDTAQLLQNVGPGKAPAN